MPAFGNHSQFNYWYIIICNIWIFLKEINNSLIFLADCVFELRRFGLYHPLVFSKDGDLLSTTSIIDDYLLNITIPANEEVILSCTPGYFMKDFNETKQLNAKCINDELLGR